MANTKVTSGVIKDDAVGADQLASNSVVTASINDNAITTAKIADDAILTAKISNSAITNAKMSSNSVDSDQYVDGSIDTAHIGDGQVTSAKLDTNIAISGTLNVTGVTTLATHLILGDDDIIKIGADDDMHLFHTTGINQLQVDQELRIQKKTGPANMIVATPDGAVELYYAGSKKFETASGGVTVTGTLTADDLEIDSGTLSVDASNNRVGIGNTSPLGKLTISNAAGANAPTSITAANTYLQLGSDDYGASSNGKFMIGFGYTDATNTNSPAYIGFEETSSSGDTKGVLTFHTRDVITDTAPTERMRIDTSGNVIVGHTSAILSSSNRGNVTINGASESILSLGINGSQGGYLFHDGTTQFLVNTKNGGQRFFTNNTERMRIDSSGNTSIGTTTSTAPLNIQSDGSARGIRIIGRDNGSSDEAAITFADNANTTTVDIITVGNALTIFQGGSETARLNAAGNLLIGTTTDVGVAGGGMRLTYPTSESDGDVYFSANGGGSNANPFVLKVVSQNLYDSGVAAMYVGRHSGNSRSINAGGTVNASGADYAEYMKKADSCGTIAKGDVCGVDSTGKLTDVFNNAISFVIKSTDPSYVGGDTWGSVDLNLTDEEYETERQKHDRIAFSGQVPVNITGSFNVGDYVYPQANGTSIQCVAKSNPTFEEYKLCVGKIWATQSDGKPLVAVKIG